MVPAVATTQQLTANRRVVALLLWLTFIGNINRVAPFLHQCGLSAGTASKLVPGQHVSKGKRDASLWPSRVRIECGSSAAASTSARRRLAAAASALTDVVDSPTAAVSRQENRSRKLASATAKENPKTDR